MFINAKYVNQILKTILEVALFTSLSMVLGQL